MKKDRILEVVEDSYYDAPLFKVEIVYCYWENQQDIRLRVSTFDTGPCQYLLESVQHWYERLKYWQQAFDEDRLESAIGLFELSKESKL